MEVILLERIDKLGQMGDLVVVKPGFARRCQPDEGPRPRGLRIAAARARA